jgi:PAS domain S-box-containing protein
VALDSAFISQINSPQFCERLFAALPDVVFCLKDHERRYRAANHAFADRLGLKNPRYLIGKRAEDFFPAPLAEAYREQDEKVLAGHEISDALELVTNRDGSLGWYLATKVPLLDEGGSIIGVASVSRDLRAPREGDAELAGVGKVAEHIRLHLDELLRVDHLAELVSLSPAQLERRMRRVFQLSTTQFIRKMRIERAAHLLSTSQMPISEVALECGYGDQTSLTRQFRATVGMPPAAYRDHLSRKISELKD